MWQTWNTAHIGRGSADFWSDVVAQGVLHAEMRTRNPRRFHGALASHTVADARFVSFKTAAHRVSRTVSQAALGEAQVMVSLQCRGVSHITQGRREVTLRPAGIALLDSARPFSIEFPDEVERRLVLLPRRLVAPWVAAIADGPMLVPDGNAAVEIARAAILQLTDTQATRSHQDYLSVTEALVALLKGAFGEAMPTLDAAAPAHLTAIKAAVRRRLHQQALTPATIARLFGLSVRSLHRLFETEDESFTRFVQRERLAQARAAIQGGPPSLTLTEIALNNGFGDASHFSRRYRAAFGEAPRETRERARAARGGSPTPA